MLNRIISGLHAAINANICENYVKNGKNKPNEPFFWGAVGNFPDRIENIYYFYSILLRYIIQFLKILPIKELSQSLTKNSRNSHTTPVTSRTI